MQLGKRDYVTGRMWKHAKGPYRLILNTAARKQINWHCEHYAARGTPLPLFAARRARENLPPPFLCASLVSAC